MKILEKLNKFHYNISFKVIVCYFAAILSRASDVISRSICLCLNVQDVAFRTSWDIFISADRSIEKKNTFDHVTKKISPVHTHRDCMQIEFDGSNLQGIYPVQTAS